MGLKMKGMKFGNEHMKNQAPMMSNNYSKSGLNPNSGDGPPFLGKLFGGARKMLKMGGGAAKLGAFGPLGMMASMMMRKRKAKQAADRKSVV